MDLIKHNLEQNARLLRGKVSKLALYGLLISLSAIILATVMLSYQTLGEITLTGIIEAQKSNFAIWILDLTPFIFMFWGQYVHSVISYEAGAMVMDQTEELRMQTNALESKVVHNSMHDALTELPNRILFIDRLSQSLTTARKEKKNIAIFIIDLNNFKEINDALGHYNGDRLLKQIAKRLTNVIQAPNTLARIGGDEFGILMPEIKSVHDSISLVKKLTKAMETSFAMDDITFSVQIAIGIAIFPDHGSDSDTLMQRADVAMYAAKQQKHDYVIYCEKLDKNSPHRLVLMGELRLAITSGDLFMMYQPKIHLKTNRVIGVEALIRWQHPKHGVIAPDEFIPMAERTGLIRQLSQWVLNTALKQCAQWQEQGIKLCVAVNLSTLDINDIELPDVIAGLLALHDVNPQQLKVEITESAFMYDQKRSYDILMRLSKMGIQLSIDDFGTGYSSLSYLSKLPINEVKIDRSFVMNMLEKHHDCVIVKAVIDLAHNLELDVVAEGVASLEILNELVRFGCDIGQGFCISRPILPKDFEAWLETQENPELIPINDDKFTGNFSAQTRTGQ